MNTLTAGLKVETDLMKQAYAWGKINPTEDDILVQFSYFFNVPYGLAIDVFAQVLVNGVQIGRFSTQTDLTLQDILDAGTYIAQADRDSGVPSENTSFLDVC